MRLPALACLCLLAACAPSRVDWAYLSEALIADGRMRVDRAPADAPFDNATLEQNFRTIAFGVEADPLGIGERAAPDETERMLLRWAGPVVYVAYGADPDRRRVLERAARLAERLGEVTGLEFREVARRRERAEDEPAPNLIILTVPDQIEALLDYIDIDNDPRLPEAGRAQVRDMFDYMRRWHGAPRSPCAGRLNVDTTPGDRQGQIFRAFVLIRTGLPDAMLDACVEEEIAQSLGLLNDDAEVRPSAFNDDQEFALLTRHDEFLLRILYDRRLNPGMRAGEAMPIVRRIIAELRPEG